MYRDCVAVLGVTGMLGHKVFQRLRESMPDVVGFARGVRESEPLSASSLLCGTDVVWGLEACDLVQLGALLDELEPRVVVNCVGIVKQRSEAKAAVPSITVNALLPHWLSERAARWGGRLIHFSTDCVFAGRRGQYTEDDTRDADDLYGRTKALGEVIAENAVTLRTSIVGRELRGRRSLIEWFLSQRGGRVQGYRRVIYSGVTTVVMAALVESLIRDHGSLNGLFQVSGEPISKLDLLQIVNRAFRAGVEIEANDEVELDRSMSSRRFRERTGWRPPSWEEMIEDVASDSTPYEQWQGLAEGTRSSATV